MAAQPMARFAGLGVLAPRGEDTAAALVRPRVDPRAPVPALAEEHHETFSTTVILHTVLLKVE